MANLNRVSVQISADEMSAENKVAKAIEVNNQQQAQTQNTYQAKGVKMSQNEALDGNPAEKRSSRRTKSKLNDKLWDENYCDPDLLPPNPEALVMTLAMGFFEITIGTRQIEHFAGLVTDGQYGKLLAIRALRARSRAVTNDRKIYPVNYRRLISQSPRPGVIESVTLIEYRGRVRAVIVRLEGFYNRWRASELFVL